jgi:hypothetical protein
MGYDLEAVIGRERVLKSQQSAFQNLEVVVLNQGFALIPMKSELLAEINASAGAESLRTDSFPDFSQGFNPDKLSVAVGHWLEDLSSSGSVMYCEAEFFGGSGGQLALIWENREVVFGPICTTWGQADPRLNVSSYEGMAINRALKKLGIVSAASSDEFDTVGLGRYRHTRDWH